MKEQTRGKRLLSILLACIMMIGLVPMTAFAAVSGCVQNIHLDGYYEYEDLSEIRCKHCKSTISWDCHESDDFLWVGSCNNNGCDCTYSAKRCYDDDDKFGAYVLYSKLDKCSHCGNAIEWELEDGIWEGDCDDDEHECECDCDFVLYSKPNVPGVLAQSTFDIEIVKEWDDKGNEEKRPDSIAVTLKANEENVNTLTLTADDEWKGVFTNNPILGEDGKIIVYTVQEGVVENYTAYTQQIESSITLTFGDKVTPASQNSYPVDGNVIVAKKGNEYYIWTENQLSEAQKIYLLSAVNEAKLNGLGAALTTDNTNFRDGLPAYFSDGSIRIISSGNNKKIYFDNHNDWSLFYVCNLKIADTAEATITNTYSPAPAPVSFSVKKVDEKNNPLANAEFTLKSTTGNEEYTQLSDSNGIVTFENIPNGTYELFESKAPDGYVLSQDEYQVTINNENTTNVIHALQTANGDGNGVVVTVPGEFLPAVNPIPYQNGAQIAEFMNVKSPEETIDISMPIKKFVQGSNAPALDFTFELLLCDSEDENGSLIYTVINDAIVPYQGGGITELDSTLTFYRVPVSALDFLFLREKQDAPNDWTYSDAVYQISVDQKNNSVEYVLVDSQNSTQVAEFVNVYNGNDNTDPDDDNNDSDNTNPGDDNNDGGNATPDNTDTGNKPNPGTGALDDVPQTGDNSSMLLWVAMILVSGLALVGTALYGRKKRAK